MFDTLNKRRMKAMNRDETAPESLPPTTDETALPALKYSTTDEDGWTILDEPLLYVYAGKGPYVGR
jgi:sphingosine kinase